MASHSRREDERFTFTPKFPHFFKIVLDKSIQAGKLGIPMKFVKKYGNGMPSLALLRVPSGEVWKVELWKSEGRIWFRKGWREFAKYYSLSQCHVLLFRYEETTAYFHVFIFDKSASEIEYPLADDDDDESIEIVEEFAPCNKKKRREKSTMEYCPRPRKKSRPELENVKQQNKSTSSSSRKGFGGLKPCERIGRGTGKSWGCSKHAKILNFRILTSNEKTRALHISNAFKSENPFFLAMIRPCNLSCPFYIGIPIDFARKFFVMSTTAEATLCLLGGETWSVKYLNTAYGHTRSEFRSGWKEFALDNGLKVGDVCVFELVKGTKAAFKVVIHRVAKDANCYPSRQDTRGTYGAKARRIKLEKSKEPRSSSCSKQGCNGGFKPCKASRGVMEMDNGLECPQQAVILRSPLLTVHEMAAAREIATSFKSQNPSFLVLIQPSHLNKHRFQMGIPSNFVRNYLMEKLPLAEATLCLPDGKTWCVDYYLNTRPRKPYVQFGRGLREFVMDNSLKAGDICVFELLNAPNILLKVAIHPNAVKLANLYPSKQDKRRACRVDCNHIESEISINTETCASGSDDDDEDEVGNISLHQGFRDHAFPASTLGNINPLKRPCFKRVLQPSSLVNCSLDIPFKFIEKHLESNDHDHDHVHEVTLQVGNRQWPAKLIQYPEFHKGKLSAGWPKFIKENSLQVGDVCVFELLNALGKAILQVSIFRRGG